MIFLLPISGVRYLDQREEAVIEHSKWTIVLGILFAFDVVLWQSSIILTSIPVAAFLANLAPIFVVIFRVFLFRKNPSLFQLLALLAGILGACALGGTAILEGTRQILGALAALTASAAFALLLVISERAPPGRGPLSRYVGMTLYAIPIVLLFSLCLETRSLPNSINGIIWIVALALIVHCISFMLFFVASSRNGAIVSSVVNLLQPASATLIGAIVFHESVTLLTAIGIGCIAAAVYLVGMDRSWSGGSPRISRRSLPTKICPP